MNERGNASHAGTPAANDTPVGITSERDRQLLADRARQLARRVGDLAAADAHASMLVFRRGDERFAIALDVVVEVQRGGELAPLPGAARPVVGVIPWRGRILTVIDIAPNAAARAPDHDWRAVVIGRGRARVVIRADTVEDATAIAGDDARPLDEEVDASARPLAPIAGVTADAVVVLDAEELLRRYPG